MTKPLTAWQRFPIKRGLAIGFLILTLFFGYQAMKAFGGGDLREVVAKIGTIPTKTWLILIPLTAFYYSLDWIRFRSVLGVLGHSIPLSYGVKLTGVSYFVTSLTPAAELHTPAMVFMLARKKIPVPAALAASVTKSIYMILWIYIVSYTALTIDKEVPMPAAIRASLPVLTFPILVSVVVLAAIAFFPRPVITLCDRLAARCGAKTVIKKLINGTAQCAHSISKIGKSGDLHHLVCHLASITFLFIYIVSGYILAHTFGIEISFARAITVFSTSLMIAYISPIPGSIAITELTTSYMLDPALTADGLAAALTLRILCWYLIAIPGGLILADTFRRDGRGWTFNANVDNAEAASKPTEPHHPKAS